MTEPAKTDNSAQEFVFIMIVIGVLLYKFTRDINVEEMKNTFLQVTYLLIMILATASALIILLYKWRRAVIRKQDMKDENKRVTFRMIEEFSNKQYEHVDHTYEAEEQLRNLRRKNPEKMYHATFLAVKKHLAEERQRIIDDYKEKQERLDEQRKKREIIARLTKQFLKQRNSDSIPEWALELDHDIVRDATRQCQEELCKREREKQDWQEAARFTLEHNAYPADFQKLELKEQEMYKKAMRLNAEGKLRVEIKNKHKKVQLLLGERFYHTDRLDYNEKQELSLAGFRPYPFIFLDGKTGNNLFIQNNPNKESDYHFCLKNLFGEFHESARVEYPIEDQRIDVAYTFGKKKVAVEIETGSNKKELVRKKVNLLNNHFDQWIIVCTRQNKRHYKQYVDKQKSFCLTVKEAHDKLQEWSTYPQDTLPLTYSKPAAAPSK